MIEMLRDSRVRAVVWALIGVLVTGLVVFVLSAAAVTTQMATVVAEVRDTQLEGTPTGKALIKSSERILDCTEAGGEGVPAGECYKRNQERTAELLRQVLGDNIVVAVCATAVPEGLPLEAAIRRVTACVLEQREQASRP